MKISKTSLVLVKGQSKKLKLKNATNKIIWSSTKKSVANVSTTGKVVAKKAGKATIVAKTGTQQKTCKVIVEEPSLSVKKLSLDLAETKKVKLSSCKHSVKWTSSNSSVAKVKKGTITAKEVGTAVIKATVHGKTYKCKVTVKKPELKEIVLKTNSVQMDYGEETQVQISTVPKKAINYYDISVQSSPKAIVSASLDEYYENNIILKSHNISGSAVVSVKMGQLTAECQINVIPCTIQSMTLNETTITLEPKKTKEIFYQVVPYKASDYYEAIWTSGNNQIVTVTTGTGIYRNCVTLNAVGEGETDITLTLGEKTAKCHVIVAKPEITYLSLNETNITLKTKQKERIYYSLLPSNAFNYYEAVWRNGNEQIAKVTTGSGIYRNSITIEAVGEGETDITLTVGNKSVFCHVIVEKPELYTWSMKKKYKK